MINRRSFLKGSTALVGGGSLLTTSRSWGAAPGMSPEREWHCYGGDAASNRYSLLDQINRSNVHDLRVAWTYHTGDKRDRPRTSMECTPIIAEGVMYVTSPLLKVIALDAATGREIWRVDPFTSFDYKNPDAESVHGVNRGVAYWQNGDDKRVFFTAASNLFCFDGQTGKPKRDFGNNGFVDLTQGLDRNISGLLYDVSSPGVIYKDLIIMGSEVGEGPEPAGPGHIRAFDVRTGEQKWIFHTVPQPGELGNDTWEADSESRRRRE